MCPDFVFDVRFAIDWFSLGPTKISGECLYASPQAVLPNRVGASGRRERGLPGCHTIMIVIIYCSSADWNNGLDRLANKESACRHSMESVMCDHIDRRKAASAHERGLFATPPTGAQSTRLAWTILETHTQTSVHCELWACLFESLQTREG